MLLLGLSPLLVAKMILNSVYILAKNKRENYRGENIVQLLMTVSLSPFIVLASIFVDLITMPSVLFIDPSMLELKYQTSDTPLTQA